MYVYTYICPPQMREIALWPSTNLSVPDIFVLAGRGSTISEITGYTHFSLITPSL